MVGRDRVLAANQLQLILGSSVCFLLFHLLKVKIRL